MLWYIAIWFLLSRGEIGESFKLLFTVIGISSSLWQKCNNKKGCILDKSTAPKKIKI